MPKKILVVDDEADVTQLLDFNLRHAGYEVVTAADGERGIIAATKEAPDLIVLDVMLPELDGFAVCEILRHKQSTSRIPIILLTACASEPARVIGLEVGADDYLVKPFSPRELILRIAKLLDRRGGPSAG